MTLRDVAAKVIVTDTLTDQRREGPLASLVMPFQVAEITGNSRKRQNPLGAPLTVGGGPDIPWPFHQLWWVRPLRLTTACGIVPRLSMRGMVALSSAVSVLGPGFLEAGVSTARSRVTAAVSVSGGDYHPGRATTSSAHGAAFLLSFEPSFTACEREPRA